MANKIAYIVSKKYNLHIFPIDEFAKFAESNGVDFVVERYSFDNLSKQTITNLFACDAVVVGSFHEANAQLLDALGAELNLYAKCSFKPTDLGNLTTQNVIVVSNVAKHAEGEFATSKAFGREAVDTLKYSELEIERTARIAYEFAEKRNHDLSLSDANTSKKSSVLWRKIVSDINEDYPSVRLDFESIQKTTHAFMDGTKSYDVILATDIYFDAMSGIVDLKNALGKGTSTLAYLGETAFGLYATECPDMFSPLFDYLAIDKMLACSFDMPKLLNAWRKKINSSYLQNKSI